MSQLGSIFGGANAADKPKLRGMVIVGFAITGLFFGIFGGWAALAPLESAAIAPGVVSVDTNRKTIQHLEGGIVGEIRVREGDVVKAGQVLIRLDEIQPRASLDLLEGRLMAAIALEARLIAERDDKKVIEFPEELLSRQDNPDTAKIIHGQSRIFESRKAAIDGQVAILGRRTAQLGEEINGLRNQIKAEEKQLALIGEEIADVDGLIKKGLARKPRLLSLKREAAEIEGSRGKNQAAVARSKQQIDETRLRVSELRINLINEVVQELREVQSELFDLSERIGAARDVLSRTEIRAPLDGTVVNLRVHTTGGVIAPGEQLLDIVPSDEPLVIEARIDPNDIDIVHPGLPAQVRLSAFSQRTMVPLDGRVVWVSADSMTDERTGQSYYLARVVLTGDPGKVLEGASLYPGMAAEVMIVTGARTAFEYLVRPIAMSLNRAFRED